MVWAFQLATIWTFGVRRRTQCMMRTTHVATGRRDFLFGNGHDRLDGGCWGDRGYLAKFQDGGNSDGNTYRSAKAGGRFMQLIRHAFCREAGARQRHRPPQRMAP